MSIFKGRLEMVICTRGITWSSVTFSCGGLLFETLGRLSGSNIREKMSCSVWLQEALSSGAWSAACGQGYPVCSVYLALEQYNRLACLTLPCAPRSSAVL
jgi:hypothetical protein